MTHPGAAVAELERAVEEHGFVGALVEHKAGNKFCDGDEYDVLWQKLQDLDIPIYLHPSWPTRELLQASYAGNYPPRSMTVIAAMWGWHSEVGVHVLRLQCRKRF
jgi:predicted TIM-barrel fold metal-dependent hydrolase